jgi:hypothetical protein
LGIVIPFLAGPMVERLVPVGLLPATTTLDWRILTFAAALSIATGLLFSLGPALQSSRASTAEALQQNARGAIGGGSTRLFRDGLVVLQVSATLVLLVAAGLMLRTLANLRAIELGFNPQGRLIDERDSATAPRAAVVNETLARQFLPNQGALGHRIRFDPEGPWFTIIGVVKNVLERGYEQDDKPAV